MRIVIWNLNHRARALPTAPWMSAALGAFRADVVVLTEYVAGSTHETFVQALMKEDLSAHLVSSPARRQNQIMVASRFPLRQGEVRCESDIPSLPSNVLHVRVESLNLDVLGIRVPYFTTRDGLENWRRTWDWLLQASTVLTGKQAVIAGDFNTDPSRPPQGCKDCLPALLATGWQHAIPETGGSFQSRTGRWSRLDYAFVTPSLRIVDASYVVETGGMRLAHIGSATLPDHAAFVLDLAGRVARP